VAVWCVVILAMLVLIGELRRDVQAPVVVVPPPSPSRSSSLSSPMSPPPEVAPQPVLQSESYVGNTNTHKFHRSTCRYAGCKNCTARFATREEAIAAGFRPGGCCDP
jgi:hypothetical protein